MTNRQIRIIAMGKYHFFNLSAYSYQIDEGGLTIWTKPVPPETMRINTAGFTRPYCWEVQEWEDK